MIEVKPMISSLFLIKNKKEYDTANKVIEERCLSDFVILSWSEKEPYMTDSCAHLKKVMKWEEFHINSMDLSRYWLVEYKNIESIARRHIESICQDEITISPYFIFGLVWKLGDAYSHIDLLNSFFKEYRPGTVFFFSGRAFADLMVISLADLYRIKHENLAI